MAGDGMTLPHSDVNVLLRHEMAGLGHKWYALKQ
jgi:hypothetical protein